MPSIDPRREDIHSLLARVPPGQPVTMLNLLRFRDRAAYADGDHGQSGREAYREYSRQAERCVKAVGGQVIWAGRAVSPIIAPLEEDWDASLLVRCPDIAAFEAMLSNPDYQAITPFRSAALSDARLIAMLDEAPY